MKSVMGFSQHIIIIVYPILGESVNLLSRGEEKEGKGIGTGIFVHTPHILESERGNTMEQTVKTLPFRRRGMEKRAVELKELQTCMEEVRRELNQAYTAFNMADDADWVESCVYEINALQARYNYLVKQAKGLGAAM